MHFTTWAVFNQESSGESETKTPTLDVKVRQRAAGRCDAGRCGNGFGRAR